MKRVFNEITYSALIDTLVLFTADSAGQPVAWKLILHEKIQTGPAIPSVSHYYRLSLNPNQQRRTRNNRIWEPIPRETSSAVFFWNCAVGVDLWNRVASVNLKIKGQSETQYIFTWDQRELRFWEVLIQEETEIVFPSGGEASGYLWEREGR